jgi:hypothetical protein
MLTTLYSSEVDRLDTTNDEIIPRSELATVLVEAQARSWGPIGTVPIDMVGSCVITRLPSKLTLTLSTHRLIQAAQMSHSHTNAFEAASQRSGTSGSAQLEITVIDRPEQVVEDVEGTDEMPVEDPFMSKRSIRRIEAWRKEVARYSDSDSATSDDLTE